MSNLFFFNKKNTTTCNNTQQHTAQHSKMVALELVPNLFLFYQGLINFGDSSKGGNAPKGRNVVFSTTSCPLWIRINNVSNETDSTNLINGRINYTDIVDGISVTNSLQFDNVAISKVNFISAISVKSSIDKFDGVFGLCHSNQRLISTNISSISLINQSDSFIEQAAKLGYLENRLFAYSIASDTKSANITFGKYDIAQYGNRIVWLPINSTSTFWESIVSEIKFSNDTIAWNGTLRTLFDTSASTLILPEKISKEINNALGFTKIAGSNVYLGSCFSQYIPEFIRLSFTGSAKMNNSSTIVLNLQMKSLIYGNGNICYSSITDGSEDIAVIGNSIFRNYYTVFNNANHTIGFATIDLNPSSDISSQSGGLSRIQFWILVASSGFVFILFIIGIIFLILYIRRQKRKKSADQIKTSNIEETRERDCNEYDTYNHIECIENPIPRTYSLTPNWVTHDEEINSRFNDKWQNQNQNLQRLENNNSFVREFSSEISSENSSEFNNYTLSSSI